MSVIYLASPYTHEDRAEELHRFRQVCQVAGCLMMDGNVVFCPVAMGHSIQEHSTPTLPRSLDWWMARDLPILEHCNLLAVLTIDGWQDSDGVKQEVGHAVIHDIPVVYLSPENYIT